MKRFVSIFLFCLIFGLGGCSSAETPRDDHSIQGADEIRSFEECVEAGHPVMRSYPPKCAAGDGRVFTQGQPGPVSSRNSGDGKGEKGGTCRDLCGNGSCEQMVCQALGCPCAETPESCPQDCASSFEFK